MVFRFVLSLIHHISLLRDMLGEPQIRQNLKMGQNTSHNTTYMYPLLPIFDYDFCLIAPSLMHDVPIRYVQHCQAMLERGVCELARFFFRSYP